MYLETSDAGTVAEAVRGLDVEPGHVVLILVGEKDHLDPVDLIAELEPSGIEFVGGIFPGVIHGSKWYPGGVIIQPIPALAPPVVATGLSEERPALPDLSAVVDQTIGRRRTALVLVDGKAPNISAFLQEMFNRFGNSVYYLGGGAGSLTRDERPCLFTREGFFEDAAVVTFMDVECRLGVGHGWEKMAGPAVATSTQSNRIISLNWRSAVEVYSQTVESYLGIPVERGRFLEVSKAHPFGIYKEGHKEILRDPIGITDDGEIVCIGEVPENTVLHIMRGDRQALIDSAGEALDDIIDQRPEGACGSLIVDCISRVGFLEEDCEQELELVASKLRKVAPTHEPIGMLTLGEISSHGEGFIELFNKTIVVGLFCA